MSTKYPGGIISKTAPVPSGSLETSTAPGIWTLEQQAYWQKLGQWPVPGNVPVYIEDYLYTYLRPAQGGSITYSLPSGVDLYNKGGIVWIKSRSAAQSHAVMNPNFKAAGGKSLQSNTAAAFDNYGTSEFAVNSGNTITMANGNINDGSYTYVDWTFVKQSKFFDVVTYTGNGTAGRTVAHNLGSVPGFMLVKITSGTGSWFVYHRSLGATKYLLLDGTGAAGTSSGIWNNTEPTSSVFTLGNDGSVNSSGVTYIAYLFAHNAGGFGATGSDNVISCGSYTESASPQDITLGYEPQWLLAKRSSSTGSAWYLFDNMRSMDYTELRYLVPNTSEEEGSFGGGYMRPTATGFTAMPGFFGNGSTVIYMAIRRGPMKVPTVGTSVFSPSAINNATNTINTTGFPIDMQIWKYRTVPTSNFILSSRLQGVSSNSTSSGVFLRPNLTTAESTGSMTRLWSNTGFSTPVAYASTDTVLWNFGRAPNFFDVVCYTGSGSPTTITHGLTVVPELIILKRRSDTEMWPVYAAPLGATKYLILNTQDLALTDDVWNNTSPTASVFSVNSYAAWNASGSTYVAYLFATLAGISKVGSYTGTGTTQTINCGFTTGSRFVMIKRTDVAGGWHIWDSARGIVPGNDPYLLLNSDAVEVTGTDYVDTASSGFEISSTAPAAINASGGNFIFLAIA